MNDRAFTAAQVVAAKGPLIAVTLGADGRPVRALCAARIAATPERVWEVVSDVTSYAHHVPMMHKVQRTGDRVTVHLKFKVSLFSVGFDFTCDATYEAGRWLQLSWVAGEPRELSIRFELEPTGDGATVLYGWLGFDVMSLGWLAKYFLKHHPEIQFGVIPGSTLAVLEAMQRAATAPK